MVIFLPCLFFAFKESADTLVARDRFTGQPEDALHDTAGRLTPTTLGEKEGSLTAIFVAKTEQVEIMMLADKSDFHNDFRARERRKLGRVSL